MLYHLLCLISKSGLQGIITFEEGRLTVRSTSQKEADEFLQAIAVPYRTGVDINYGDLDNDPDTWITMFALKIVEPGTYGHYWRLWSNPGSDLVTHLGAGIYNYWDACHKLGVNEIMATSFEFRAVYNPTPSTAD